MIDNVTHREADHTRIKRTQDPGSAKPLLPKQAVIAPKVLVPKPPVHPAISASNVGFPQINRPVAACLTHNPGLRNPVIVQQKTVVGVPGQGIGSRVAPDCKALASKPSATSSPRTVQLSPLQAAHQANLRFLNRTVGSSHLAIQLQSKGIRTAHLPMIAKPSRILQRATQPVEDSLARLMAMDPVTAAGPTVKSLLMAEINLPRMKGRMMDRTRPVNSKLYGLWLGLDEGRLTAQQAIESLQEWAGETDAYQNYVSDRVDYWRELTAAPLVTRQTVILRARSRAMADAFSDTKQHSTGPDGQTGKTIACIVETKQNRSWVGHSGIGNHQVAVHPRMTALLNGVVKVEEWPTHVCAEVDAMKQALQAGADEDDLVFYCFTWNGTRWTGKTACANCRQWIQKLRPPE
jgi:hypothetical protein